MLLQRPYKTVDAMMKTRSEQDTKTGDFQRGIAITSPVPRERFEIFRRQRNMNGVWHDCVDFTGPDATLSESCPKWYL
jgi:hypothetical protein